MTRTKESIEHYGVLGMKWGVRKQPDGGTAKTGSSSDDSSGYQPKAPGVGAGGDRKAAKRNVKAAKKEYKTARKSAIKEVQSRSKSEMIERDRSHAEEVVKSAVKNPGETIIAIGGPNVRTTITTGKEFVDHLAAGGAFSPAYTTVIGPKGTYNNENHRTRFSAEGERRVNEMFDNYAKAKADYKTVKRR